MPITRAQIERALDDMISHEEGFRFQSLGVILATQKCGKLVAHEKKADLGLDAYAPGIEFADHSGRGTACSLTATLSKVRKDIEEAQKEFKDLGVLYFVTSRHVGEKRKRKEQQWIQKVERDYGITLIVMSREHVITALLSPENANLCANHLHIESETAPVLEQILELAHQAIADVNASWKARVEGEPLIELSASRLSTDGCETNATLELADFEQMLLQGLRMTLEAPAGRGKTTTLTQIAERRARAGGLVFLIDLPAWAQDTPDILEFIAGMEPFRTRHIDAAKLGQLYRSQSFVFLLNGWNEIAEADLQRTATGLETLARDYRTAGILLATRVRQVTPPLPGTTVRTKLKLLSRQQRATYAATRVPELASVLLNKLDHEPVLDELTRTPFFLSRVVSIVAVGQDVPNTKIGVLREVIRLLENDSAYRTVLQSSPLHGDAHAYLIAIAGEMTSKSQTQLSETDTRRLLIRTLRKMHEEDLIDGTTTANQVLDALASRHVLERMEYPHPAYRFEHQQFQEFYAAEFLKSKLLQLTADASNSREQIAGTDAAREFQTQYINQSAWSEPLYMLASDLADDSNQLGDPGRAAIRASALLLDLALPVDMIFAAELFALSSSPARDQIIDKFNNGIRALWVSPQKHLRAHALTAMIATGSEMFKDELIPMLQGRSGPPRFEVYRSTSAFRLSSIGPDWMQEVRSWDESPRMTFALHIARIAAPTRETAAFALADPSVKVRAVAFSNLMWINTDPETTKLLTELDDDAFELAIVDAPVRNTHPIFRERALKIYRKVLQESTDPQKRYVAAANAVLMKQEDAHPALMQYLDECSPERVQELARRELKPLLEALFSDLVWRERFVIRRVREGALTTKDWGIFITSINEELKEELLNRLETEDLTRARVSGVQGLLRLTANPSMVQRIFRRIVALREGIQAANSIRSQENIALAQQLASVERQLQDFLDSLPPQVTAEGVLSGLSSELSLDELAVVTSLWRGGLDDEVELDEALSEQSLEAVRKYLKDAVPRLNNENDPRGEMRAYLALAISRVGDSEDVSDIEALMTSDVERIVLGLAARTRRERTPLAEGSAHRYTNLYVQAIRQLKSESEGAMLARFLSEPNFELQVAWGLVAWAMKSNLPRTVWIEGWATRDRKFDEVWEARATPEITGFNEERRVEAVQYLLRHIENLRLSDGGAANEGSMVWRLKDLARPLAILDGRNSSQLVLEILALPLKTHGTLDAWKVLPTLEALLFSGASLPNDKTNALIAPYIEELTSKWQSDNDLTLLGTALCVLSYVEDAAAGIATLAEYLDQMNLRLDGLRKVIAALGSCRRDEALDVLLSLLRSNEVAQRFGQDWLDAMAALDTVRAREILLSIIDPGIPGIQNLKIIRIDSTLAARIGAAAKKHPEMKARLLALCKAPLDLSRKQLLGDVIVALKDEESLLASLDLLDDEASPDLPYRLQDAIEEAFVAKIPDQNFSSYTLQPRTATELREKLIEMSKSDSRRKQSALRTLARIESWRLDYGRPIGESRNPLLGVEVSWPPEGWSQDTTES
jgi:hypothetical protein